jgi:hypothetical protein
MERHCKTLATLLAFASAASAHAFGFGDIEYWFGNGANEAGLVVQWDTTDAPQALAWGVRFDGALTADAVFDAVLGDPRLFAFQDGSGAGRVVYGIGYDTDGGGVAGSGYTLQGPLPDDAVANDPTDKWKAGWFVNGYWSLWEAHGPQAAGFAPASVGVGSLVVGDDDWVLWAFAPAANGWTTEPPTDIAAAPVPEPSALLAMAAGAALLRKRRRR